MDDTYPGIEIRVRGEHGEFLNHRSDVLHYELRKMWLMHGFTGDEWSAVGGTVLRSVLVEIRAVDVPAPPHAPSYPHEFYGLDADEAAAAYDSVDGQAAELEPCANCPSIAGCLPFGRCLIGAELQPGVDALTELEEHIDAAALERYMTPPDRAELEELTRRLAELEERLAARAAQWRAAGYRPAPSSAGWDDGAGGSLTEPVSEPARARRPRPRLNTGVARIARLARFRSGR